MVEVIVYCIVYNHEKHLRRCLDGFVMQKTDFSFSVVVHDDCSTDSSAEIISEYAEKYPQIIMPVLDKINRYSNDPEYFFHMYNSAESRYVALCEGDDYWCDENKLQRQYDYMEAHPECYLCCHDTLVHDLTGEKEDRNFLKSSSIRQLTAEEVFDAWLIHLSSYFFRNDHRIKMEWGKGHWAGDYVMATTAYAKGPVDVLPQVMSVYNYRNPSGATVCYNSEGERKKIEKTRSIGVYLRRYLENVDADDAAREVILRRIAAVDEASACDELICDINERTEEDGGGDKDAGWITERLNDELIRRECTSPAKATENNGATFRTILLFRTIQIYLSKYGIKPGAFLAALTRLFTDPSSGAEELRIVRESVENSVGWFLK
ncbi:MAG: glycosyltransferase [Lachnospiraceae bacterium]|nr:glycosyltransferase [Lachnospiraceae bacterium]